eukprot:6492621-Amphidinium_carterae.4
MICVFTESVTDCIKESTLKLALVKLSTRLLGSLQVSFMTICRSPCDVRADQLLHNGGNTFLDEPLDLWHQVLGPFLRLQVATALAQDSSAPLMQLDGLRDVLPKD